MLLIAASSGVHPQVIPAYFCDRARCGASKALRHSLARLCCEVTWSDVSIKIMINSLAHDRLLARWIAVVFMLCVAAPAVGQTDLPDAPPAQSSDAQASQSGAQSQQTSRILGIIPNFRAVSSTEHLPAQTVRQKFVTATQDSLDYSALFVPTVLAGINLARRNTPEFGTGAVGYGRYWWHGALDQTSENYMVEFVVPALTHQDT